MQDPHDFTELESLFKQSRIAYRAVHAKDKPTKEIVEEPKNVLFMRPENWERIRGVALVHKETQTVLGIFTEYSHRKVENCKKLVREEPAPEPEGIEYVSGDGWVERLEAVPHSQRCREESEEVTMQVKLDDLEMFGTVHVLVTLCDRFLSRIELVEPATLHSSREGEHTSITFPAGLCIRELLSRDSKIAIRQALSI